MNLKSAAVFVLILIELILGENNTTDYCGYELLTNLDGKAYTIEHDAANTSVQLFLNRMMHEHNQLHFKQLFGHDLVDVLNTLQWYYNFETVGKINRSSNLPESFRCIYGDAWNLPANQTSATELNFLTLQFYSFTFFDRLAKQIPSSVPLPIFFVNGPPNYKIWCNFGKSSYRDNEYFIIMLYMEDDGKQFLVIQLKDKKSGVPILM